MTLFRQAGYKVQLLDEFHTRCRYNAYDGHGVCSMFRDCNSPTPYGEERSLRHSLVQCQTCMRLWDQDINASSNVWKIASNAVQGLTIFDELIASSVVPT